jgi:phosphoglycerate dehydrogenase-like enzyme
VTNEARRALAVVYDPIRTFPWSYEHELATLAERGVDLALPDNLEQARKLLPDADAVVVSTKLPNDDLELLERCCGILCYSVGKDGVDNVRAAELGITVDNVPDYCTEEVSDHAVALLLSLERLVFAFGVEGAAGNWDVRGWPEFLTMRRLSELVVGVVGVGRIGSRVAEKLRGLGMRILGYDPYPTSDAHEAVELVGFDDLLRLSDAVVLCAALTDESRRLIDGRALAMMRPDAVLVNVARGALVDESALASALREGRLRGAALDVRSPEPPDPVRDPLLGHRNVILTQHVGATSIEAFQDMHRLSAERILGMLEAAGRIPALKAVA